MRWKKLANFGKHPSSSKRRAKSQNNPDINMIDSPSSSILVVRVIDCGGVKKAAYQLNDFLFEKIVKTSFIIKKNVQNVNVNHISKRLIHHHDLYWLSTRWIVGV